MAENTRPPIPAARNHGHPAPHLPSISSLYWNPIPMESNGTPSFALHTPIDAYNYTLPSSHPPPPVLPAWAYPTPQPHASSSQKPGAPAVTNTTNGSHASVLPSSSSSSSSSTTTTSSSVDGSAPAPAASTPTNTRPKREIKKPTPIDPSPSSEGSKRTPRSNPKRKGPAPPTPTPLTPPATPSTAPKAKKGKGKGKADPALDHEEVGTLTHPHICPMCTNPIYGDVDDVNRHIDRCLAPPAQISAPTAKGKGKGKKSPKISAPVPSSSHDPREDEMDQGSEEEEEEDGFEVYTIAGQTRVRVTSMVEGGLHALFGEVKRKNREEDDEGELNVDEDDSAKFGSAQFTERDLRPSKEEWVGGSGPVPAVEDEAQIALAIAGKTPQELGRLICRLRARVKEQEAQLAHMPKCLICLEPHRSPVTSINCWHVHCEQCWLGTLSAKRLCPQCNIITAPADLRRVYLG
eukprot:TRINITY_DN9331_c0_g3_i2.p1 TRINITY_DN9331_c0_g3~~TRINITY_DN9331_c0_g3_i2.p1  ORF type:complete len:463 (-),score=149.63 TRINITY_DN9331_c0_g3_i2:77-1465(-)